MSEFNRIMDTNEALASIKNLINYYKYIDDIEVFTDKYNVPMKELLSDMYEELLNHKVKELNL